MSIMIKRAFTLSANIENGMGESTEYIVTPNATKVLQQIVENYQTGIHSFVIVGTYGTGKSSFLLNLEREISIPYRKRRLLKDCYVLKDLNVEVLNIVGDTSSLSSILAERLNLEKGTSGNDVLKHLKSHYERVADSGKYLLIAIDEFGKVLEHAARNNPEEELYFFQKLTEMVNVPSRHIVLLTTLHQNFSAYAGKLNQVQRNEWNKVKGRFQEVVFAEPIEQLLLVASEHISSDIKYDVTDDNFARLYRLAIDSKFVSSTLSFDTASRLYPVDVFAAYAITRAIQRYGQNERSLFSFLNDRGPHSIYSCQGPGHIYNLADAYDYVANSFYSSLSDVNSDSSGWSAVRLSIERVEGCGWKSSQEMLDAIRLVKAIGMANLFGNAGFSMNKLDLASYAEMAMGMEFANVIIHRLSQLKIIRYAEYKGRIVLFEGTDINIEDEIAKASMAVAKPVRIVDDLRVYFNNRVAPVRSYYYHRGTPRYFEYILLDAPEMIVPAGEKDGVVEMIFPTSEAQYDELVDFSRNCDEALIFAYFRNTDELTNHLYNIQKYAYIIDKVLVDKSDRVAIRELTQLIDYEKNLINKSLRDSLFSYSGDVTWIFRGDVKRVESHRDFNRLLSEVCNDVYAKTPYLNNELINKHKLSSNISGAKAKYFQALIEHSEMDNLGFDQEKFPPEKTIYCSLLKNTGLHVDGIFADKPRSGGIDSLWYACEEFLASSIEKPRKLSELVKVLSSRPYKVKDGLLEFWVPTYLFIKRQEYALYGENGQFIPEFNSELLDLMKKHLGEFRIKAFANDGVKIQLFNQYRKFLHLGDKSRISGSSFIDTVKPFIYFYNRQLNDYAKHTRTLSHVETVRFRDVLSQAKDPEKAFLEDMPKALGYDDEKLRDEQAVQDYCSVIMRSVRELRACYNQLIDRIEANLIEKLGLKSNDYSVYVCEVQNKLSKVKPHLLTPHQREFYQHVMSGFDNRTEWYQSVCYVILNSPLDRLRDEQEPKLHDDLVFMFRECEKKAVLSESLEYRIDEKEEERARILESRIDGILTGDDNLDVFTLMRVLQKRLNNG